MMIVVYDKAKDSLVIAPEEGGIQRLPVKDPAVIELIGEEEDILYVQRGSLISKEQFQQWISGDFVLEEDLPESTPSGLDSEIFVHPTNNGIVTVSDIITERFPKGLVFESKYHFIPVSHIGRDVLDGSPIYRHLVRIKRLEEVNGEYVRNNIHKAPGVGNQKMDRMLSKILIPPGRKAEDVASSGGLDIDDELGNIAIPINIRVV